MNRRRIAGLLLRVAIAATLAISGYIHAQLYVGSYRFIHIVGVLFLLQASACLALAVLVLVGAPVLLRVAAAGAAAGALAGFVLSRTVGVFGFLEHGWQPAPQPLLSVLAETTTLLLLAPTFVIALHRELHRRTADSPAAAREGRSPGPTLA